MTFRQLKRKVVARYRRHGPGGNYTLWLYRPPTVPGWDTHTVDVGPLYIGEPTHTTRDGLPMSVQWEFDKGYLVAIDTTSGLS